MRWAGFAEQRRRFPLAFNDPNVGVRGSLPLANKQTENLVMQLYLEGYLDIGKLYVLATHRRF
jgi:hypothetical protein